MKKLWVLVLLSASLIFVFSSCSKENASSEKDDSLKYSISDQDADIILKGDGKYEKVITKPLVKKADCKYIVEGTIEFHLDGEVVAIVDFGNGDCDNIATKTVDGETHEFELNKKDKIWKYDKIIVEPLVKKEDCLYIVSGIVQFIKGDVWIATIDFGDGECDEWATKTWDGGSEVFSMAKE